MTFVWKRCHSALSLCVCLSKKARNYGYPHFRKGMGKVGMTNAHQEPDSVLQLFWWIYFSVCLGGIYVYMFVCMNMCECACVASVCTCLCVWTCVRVNAHTCARGGWQCLTLLLSTLQFIFYFYFFEKGSQVAREPLVSISLTPGFFTQVLMIRTQAFMRY